MQSARSVESLLSLLDLRFLGFKNSQKLGKKTILTVLILGHGEMFEVEKQKQCKIIQAPNLFASQPFNLEPFAGLWQQPEKVTMQASEH